MNETIVDKRQFQRVELNVPGELGIHGDQIPVTIEDVSLQGAASERSRNHAGDASFR